MFDLGGEFAKGLIIAKRHENRIVAEGIHRQRRHLIGVHPLILTPLFCRSEGLDEGSAFVTASDPDNVPLGINGHIFTSFLARHIAERGQFTSLLSNA